MASKGNLPVIALMALLLVACGSPEPQNTAVNGVELAALLAKDSAPVILDVRTPEEFDAGHIPGALNIPHTELEARLEELGPGKEREIVVHCKSGKRAAMASELLVANGFTTIRELDGHMDAWEAAGFPLER
ncbi:MAG: rhodanese-like domain-containing protein [Gammaproteobacteria bacterium]|nr:rhodanese-like domain-containing protein [Gammaproteobacteria bacterium]